ncbi:GntR family transcriptional regulator / MocR family aminotransferase [Brevibacterium pityocampae]
MARNDLRIDLDRSLGIALPVQIIRGIRAAVAAGRLAPGDRLPSARACAEALGVSRGTVDTAYAQLAAEGYVVQRPRSGTVIDPELQAAALAAPSAPRSSPVPRVPAVRVDLRPGRGGESPLGEAAFRTAWRRALDVRPAPPDPLGEEPLRRAIAEHLRVMRGMVVGAEDIVVTAGSRDGVALVLAAIGADSLVVEDPGFPGLRRALHGVELVPVAVDAEGLPPAGLAGAVPAGGAPGRPPEAALVTPNHQFPYGTAMPAGRRAALCRWAADAGMLLIEDDYDSEARYLGPAVPPLFDSAPGGGVVHIGTFSTVLTAAVGTGYIVARGPEGARIRAARERLGPAVPPVMQHALAEYLAAGGLRRRIARGRRRLRAAEAVVAEFSHLPGLVHRGRGLVVEMPAEATREAHRALAVRGIRVGDLAAGWSGEPRRHGLVIAHANAAPVQLREVFAVIAGCG